MSIRGKIVLVVLPLIITPLLLTGFIGALAARNGLTTIATEFLRFKIEELVNYANSQYTLLLANNLIDSEEYVEVSKSAIGSFAQSIVRSDTELILAFDDKASLQMSSKEVEISQQEISVLKELIAEGHSGWQQISLVGVQRVAQLARFEPFRWTIMVTEEQGTFYRSINQMYRQTGIILAATSILSVLLLLVFSYYLTRPLRNVVSAMKEIIATGDLSKRVEVLYRDETGELGHTFNLMTGELDRAYGQVKGFALQAVIAQSKEQKIRNIFQKYVPKDVIDQYFRSPESMLIGEDRILAVLFSDVRSFTALSENMLPNEVVESLNTYFGMMVEIIMNHRGIVDKYMGDAIMAFYGAPVRHRDEAYQAVQSGFEMLEALKEFNLWQANKNRPPFRIGIGINYGVVTVGNIGSEKKMDYTVIGDMVNLASRLEGLTKIYREQMIVSESVFKYVEKQIPCRLLDKVIVKGKSSGIGIYTPRQKLSNGEEEGWYLHNEGVRLYYSREFERAARFFQDVQTILPGDRPSQLFFSRCQKYMKSAPQEGWTGAVVMTEK
jgi:adenylate cyclase